MALTIGERLGPYDVIALIGEGGMGQVYRAIDTQLGRDVALKVLPEALASDPNRLARFQREAELLARLNHPNIAQIHGIEEAAGMRALVLELVEGQTLADRIARGPVPLDEALPVAVQITEALEAAHEAGVIHRDLKPANIKVRDDGTVKVLDFGVAKRAVTPEADTRSTLTGLDGPLIGTLAYMSPEQLRGDPIDPRSDIFSIGIVFYELLTGRNPFRRVNTANTIDAILRESPPSLPVPPSDASGELGQILHRMLEKDAGDRFRSIRDVRARLQSVRVSPAAQPISETSTVDGARQEPRSVVARSELSQRVAEKWTAAQASTGAAHMVGRETDLAWLHERLDAARQTKGHLACVAGEAGRGKTTLVEAFLDGIRGRTAPCVIAQGRSSERLAGSEGYLPMLEALERLNREYGAPLRELMRATAPTWYVEAIAWTEGGDPGAQILAETRARSPERMKRELTAFVEALGVVGPVILVLEDLHWADLSTVDLVAHLGARCGALPLVILATYRRDELLLSENQFEQVRLQMSARGLCSELRLDFLDATAVDEYLALEYPSHRFPVDLPPWIHGRTEGNPLFVANLVHHLRDRGAIACEADVWTLRCPIAEIEDEVPVSLQSMIQRKIDQLDADDRTLLSIASVQGNDFDSATLADALQRDLPDVEDRLMVLQDVHGFVKAAGEVHPPSGPVSTGYQFVHILYQNALYGSLSRARRTAWSRALAECLIRSYGQEADSVAARLGFLLEQARDHDRAAAFFKAAAEASVRASTAREGVRLLRRSIENSDRLGDAGRQRSVETRIRLGQVLQGLSLFDEAVGAFGEAERLARDAGLEESVVQAICGIGLSEWHSYRVPIAKTHAVKALEIARARSWPVGIAMARALEACVNLSDGHLEECREDFDASMGLLLKPDPRASGVALHAAGIRSIFDSWTLDYAQAETTIRWGLSRSEELSAMLPMCQNRVALIMVLGNQGRMTEALRVGHESMSLAELHDVTLFIPRMQVFVGWLYTELQDYETAVELTLAGIRSARDVGQHHPEGHGHLSLGILYTALGQLDRVQEHLDEAGRLFDRDDFFRWRFKLKLDGARAAYGLALGDLDAASTWATRSLESSVRTDSYKYATDAHRLLADVARLDGRPEDARQHLKAGLETLERHPCPIEEWKVLRSATLLASEIGEGDAWQRRFRASAQRIADQTDDERLRQIFLRSELVGG